MQELLRTLFVTFFRRPEVLRYSKSLVLRGTDEADEMAIAYVEFLGAITGINRLGANHEQLSPLRLAALQVFLTDDALHQNLAEFVAETDGVDEPARLLESLMRHQDTIAAMSQFVKEMAPAG